jgi:hypothetical protein
MAEFIYKDYSCKLKFGEFEYNIPLNEQTAGLIEKSFSDKVLPPKFEGLEDMDAFYNNVMDAIDEVLGEGAAENIMSRFAHAGALEIMGVVHYISTEFNTQYAAEFDEMKKTAHLPNRETRRANNKGGRR